MPELKHVFKITERIDCLKLGLQVFEYGVEKRLD